MEASNLTQLSPSGIPTITNFLFLILILSKISNMFLGHFAKVVPLPNTISGELLGKGTDAVISSYCPIVKYINDLHSLGIKLISLSLNDDLSINTNDFNCSPHIGQ